MVQGKRTDNYSAGWKSPCFFTNLNVNYVHKSWLLDPFLRQLNPVHTLCLTYVLMLSFHPLQNFLQKILCTFLISPTHVTCPAHVIFCDLIILTVRDKKYTLWSSSLCHFLQHAVASSFLDPNMLNTVLKHSHLSSSLTAVVSKVWGHRIFWESYILKLNWL
jgi:hypothetical protein